MKCRESIPFNSHLQASGKSSARVCKCHEARYHLQGLRVRVKILLYGSYKILLYASYRVQGHGGLGSSQLSWHRGMSSHHVFMPFVYRFLCCIQAGVEALQHFFMSCLGVLPSISCICVITRLLVVSWDSCPYWGSMLLSVLLNNLWKLARGLRGCLSPYKPCCSSPCPKKHLEKKKTTTSGQLFRYGRVS